MSTSINVSLTEELERFVDGKVESGLYKNASEVVREGLRLLKENDEFRALVRESIERGWAQAQAGEMLDGPTVMAELRQRVRTEARSAREPAVPALPTSPQRPG
jgi:antitoxin ParD1/3/4